MLEKSKYFSNVVKEHFYKEIVINKKYDGEF